MLLSTVSPPGDDFPECLPMDGELTIVLIKTVEGKEVCGSGVERTGIVKNEWVSNR